MKWALDFIKSDLTIYAIWIMRSLFVIEIDKGNTTLRTNSLGKLASVERPDGKTAGAEPSCFKYGLQKTILSEVIEEEI